MGKKAVRPALTGNLNIKKKVILGIAAVFFAGWVTTNLFYISHIRKVGHEGIIRNARAITVMGEAIREYQSENWDRGLYDRASLSKDIRGKFVYSVPVFSSIITMKKKAKELGYAFRVPKFEPRNPENKPDAIEAAALKEIASKNLKEYYRLDDDRQNIRYYRPIRLTRDCLLCHGDPATSKKLWGRDDGTDPIGGRMENWKEGEIHGAFEIIYSSKDILSLVYGIIIQNVIVNILLVVGALFFIRYIVKRALNPLDVISRSLEEINRGAGDLTKKIEVLNRDEVGEVALLFNGFLDQLKKMIVAVRDASDHVLFSSTEMRTASENLAHEAQEQAASIEETSSSMEEIKATIDSVSANAKSQAEKAGSNRASMEYLSKSIGEINGHAQEANRMANDTHTYAIEGEQILVQTVDSMKEIYDSSTKITEIVTIITDISDKINLLSLNASIEAARAGEHGRGFAVVAEEIAKLADQTANSSGEINRLIQESTQKISAGSELVSRTASSLRRIIDNVKQTASLMENIARSSVELDRMSAESSGNASMVNAMSEEISVMMQEQSISSNEIIKAINQINEITQGVASGSEELAASAEELSTQSEVLKEIVASFKVD